jgi:predicted ferric reductase
MSDLNPARQEQESIYNSAGPALAILIAVAFGAALALVLVPGWSPGLAATLLGSNPKAYWYLSRATAFVALTLLWLSMIFGLVITDKMARAWPGAQAAFSLHEYFSLLGLGFAAFHAFILLGDHYIGYTVAQILLPFAGSGYRPFWVGIGQITLYVWAIVSVTFYIKKLITHAGWKLIHFASFFSFVAAIIHGLASGTDSGSAYAQAAYWTFGVSVFFLLVYRVAAALAGNAAPAPKGPKQPETSPPGTPAG